MVHNLLDVHLSNGGLGNFLLCECIDSRCLLSATDANILKVVLDQANTVLETIIHGNIKNPWLFTFNLSENDGQVHRFVVFSHTEFVN